MAIVNTLHKRALKAAVARLAVREDTNVTAIALAIQDAAVEMGLQAGNMSCLDAISNYALGVRANGEGSCNRRWAVYAEDVRALSNTLCTQARLQIHS